MHSQKIITLTTSQDQPAYVWHHRGLPHAGGSTTVTVNVKLPKTSAHDGFPGRVPRQRHAEPTVFRSRHQQNSTFIRVWTRPLVAGSFSALVMG